MFTGIVEELGIVQKLEQRQNLYVLSLRAKKILKGLKKGDSVAINGVCLTATSMVNKVIRFDIMKESILKTTLGFLKTNDRVNLERALKIGSRFGGHFMTGHVDDLAKILNRVEGANYTEFQISLPQPFKSFIVEKGSICVDGVSLTVGKVAQKCFSVYLIPFTKKITTLGLKKKGDFVNIELDILAKYILNK